MFIQNPNRWAIIPQLQTSYKSSVLRKSTSVIIVRKDNCETWIDFRLFRLAYPHDRRKAKKRQKQFKTEKGQRSEKGWNRLFAVASDERRPFSAI